ncbi:VpsF family polysaccharide biosynthesis protein [Rhodopila sp.]|uniref:VpsF family polysaccharide biosynthesis protein n=1 Tax=Rhodopila sp. TaxID=2480087 RepID=UPI003D0E7CE8
MRNMRTLERKLVIKARRTPGSGIFLCAVVCILLQFFVTNNVVRVIAGHDVNIRFHPANIIMMFCAFYALANGPIPFHQRCREAPGLILFVFAIPLFAIYTAWFNGLSGAAFYFDSFWGAGLLAVALEGATDRQKRFLAKLLLALVLMNVLFGLFESLTQHNLFPFVANDDVKQAEIQATANFRANAFYPHPLTASLITGMAFFLLYVMQLRFLAMAPAFLLILIGLLAFGGRTALFVTVGMSGLAACWVVLSGIIKRNLKLEVMGYLLVAVTVLPLITLIIVTQTTIADRIVNTLYFDDSAEVRVFQWTILNYLSLKNWLFGVPLQELTALKYQIGLDSVEDIENFWLLLFLNLGAVGFVAFLFVFGAFLVHIARYGHGMYAWMLMISALIIDSGSNSLGQKSNDLVIEVAFLVAMSGYRNYTRQTVRRIATSTPMRTEGLIRARIPPRIVRGLRVLNRAH